MMHRGQGPRAGGGSSGCTDRLFPRCSIRPPLSCAQAKASSQVGGEEVVRAQAAGKGGRGRNAGGRIDGVIPGLQAVELDHGARDIPAQQLGAGPGEDRRLARRRAARPRLRGARRLPDQASEGAVQLVAQGGDVVLPG